MDTLFFFVLRERATERLLSRTNVATRAEFGDNGPPRLFTTRQAAASALNCWRQGVWQHYVDGYGESEGPQPPDPSKAWCKEIIARRHATEIDIVMVTVKESEPELPHLSGGMNGAK